MQLFDDLLALFTAVDLHDDALVNGFTLAADSRRDF